MAALAPSVLGSLLAGAGILIEHVFRGVYKRLAFADWCPNSPLDGTWPATLSNTTEHHASTVNLHLCRALRVVVGCGMACFFGVPQHTRNIASRLSE